MTFKLQASLHIDKIYINTHRYDLALTRICVSSIRYWYADIPIYLIVDYSNGPLPARRMMKKWNLHYLDTGRQHYGWGFGKFEPLFLANNERFLVLDADTVITGPVLDKVQQLEADFVVDQEVQPDEKFEMLYYDPVKAGDLFPGFTYPGYSFNTGQWVGKGNVLTKDDFNDFVTWTPSPKLKYPDYFKQADQGIFNLLVHIKEKEKKIRVEKIPLMIWPDNGAANFIDLNAIKERKNDFPFVVHWAGFKMENLEDFPRGDILEFYEDYYYSKYSRLAKFFDQLKGRFLKYERKLRYRINKARKGK